jgi:DNA repair ATPase RecN
VVCFDPVSDRELGDYDQVVRDLEEADRALQEADRRNEEQAQELETTILRLQTIERQRDEARRLASEQGDRIRELENLLRQAQGGVPPPA